MEIRWDRESASVKRSCERLWDEDIADLEELIAPFQRRDVDEASSSFESLETGSRGSSSLGSRELERVL